MPGSKQDQMAELEQQLGELTDSPLYEFRVENGYEPVIGEGSLDAKIMFIGEAPGKREAETGRPFVGASGRVLGELLQLIGLEREDVYITNVVKDRPPDNRDPRPDEIELYAPLLERQLDIIHPRVIATLGRFAMEFIIDHFDLPHDDAKISRIHGQVIRFQRGGREIAFVPLYHPAVALYNRNQRTTLEEDFRGLRQFFD